MILALCLAAFAWAQPFDIVIAGGRVLDPETKLDGVRHIGIRAGRIAAVSARPLRGKQTIEAKGMIVAPGFIDLHSHGQSPENYRAKAMDGVTTALELEIGEADIDSFYSERTGKALVHYGASIGHIPLRMKQFGDKGTRLPADAAISKRASPEDITEMARGIEKGLQRGAVGVGMGVAYTTGAGAVELLDMFRVAARFKVPVFVHVRSGVEGLNEVIGYAATTGASLHVVHLNSSGARRNTPHFLRIIEEARKRGLDITTECYPYTAGSTRIESAILDDGWQERLGISYGDLRWVPTGERLTADTFARYRKQGGRVILFTNSEEMVRRAVLSPLTMIASDGGLTNGQGHPRSTGAFARVLSEYVRKEKSLDWMTAMDKMSLMPARRLESFLPAMKRKGRIQVGADADVVVIDPEQVADQSTYDNPAAFSRGFLHVLVNGTPVVRDGKLDQAVLPGQPVRGPLRE